MPVRTSWSFHSAGQLVFGRGAIADLGRWAARRKWANAFLVTDQRLAAAGLVEQVVAPLKAAGIAVAIFDGGEPEPAIHTAVKAIEQARGVGPDCIVGLGGGSNMDLAKIVATVLAHGGS